MSISFAAQMLKNTSGGHTVKCAAAGSVCMSVGTLDLFNRHF